MDESEFERVLNLFPVVRARDYHADTAPPRPSTAQSSQLQTKKGTASQGDKHGAFWLKLKMAAEKKVGPVEAEKFVEAFQRVHNKLVHEELSPDVARDLLSSYKS